MIFLFHPGLVGFLRAEGECLFLQDYASFLYQFFFSCIFFCFFLLLFFPSHRNIFIGVGVLDKVGPDQQATDVSGRFEQAKLLGCWTVSLH